jgi:hypothetical protein
MIAIRVPAQYHKVEFVLRYLEIWQFHHVSRS